MIDSDQQGAQLINLKQSKLEMDFIVEGDHKSIHILNAVSPGWVCRDDVETITS
jgi:hypothetical protein